MLVPIALGAVSAGLLAGGYAYAANWPTSQIFGTTLVTGLDEGTGRHDVALTYDDGPSPRNTPALLDLLAQHNARATFFLMGEHVRRSPDLARRIAAAGHRIGNHTATHPNLAKQSRGTVHRELLQCHALLADTVGAEPLLFRPPFGARTPGVLRAARSLGLTPVMWNLTAHDWEPIDADQIMKRIEQGMTTHRKRGVASNILLHDASHLDTATQLASRASTVEVTRRLLQRTDLRFVTPDLWMTTDRPQ